MRNKISEGYKWASHEKPWKFQGIGEFYSPGMGGGKVQTKHFLEEGARGMDI